jgi:putative oxidoreductase
MVLGLGATRMVVSLTVNEREDDAMTRLAGRYYRLLIRAASSLQSPFLLAVRLYWGWQFMQTGWGKLNDSQKVIGFFTHLGIPAPALNAYFISGLEFAGGFFLILGLGSRLIALPLAIDMMVAYIAADREALFSIFSDPDKFTGAAPYTFLVASLIVLIFGPGKASVDAFPTVSMVLTPFGKKERRHYDYDENSGSPGFRLDVRSDVPDPSRAYRQAC